MGQAGTELPEQQQAHARASGEGGQDQLRLFDIAPQCLGEPRHRRQHQIGTCQPQHRATDQQARDRYRPAPGGSVGAHRGSSAR